MTKRQRALGVTDYGYQRGIKEDEFLADNEAFLAKLATIKKGQYTGLSIAKKWFPELGDYALRLKLEEMKPFLYGLSVLLPENFYYTNDNGLDCLTVR